MTDNFRNTVEQPSTIDVKKEPKFLLTLTIVENYSGAKYSTSFPVIIENTSSFEGILRNMIRTFSQTYSGFTLSCGYTPNENGKNVETTTDSNFPNDLDFSPVIKELMSGIRRD